MKNMKWEKKGLIYTPAGESAWRKHSFMTPTPLKISDDVIRLYGGFRDDEGVSRIGYIDLDAHNPARVLAVSQNPALDIGPDGGFDDNGVILGDVLRVGDDIYMYYVGFQLVKKAKFLAFTGLAISKDNGQTFTRHSRAPVMDRTDKALHIRALHSITHEDGIFRAWYARGKGNSWQIIDEQPFPAYHIWYAESEDGIHFSEPDTLCIDTQGSEYRIGRPRVYKQDGTYHMFYTRDFIERNYIAGYAHSPDGLNWTRADIDLGLCKSDSGWDSEMACYPVFYETNDKYYMFYNGNGFGRTGVGYAECIKDA